MKMILSILAAIAVASPLLAGAQTLSSHSQVIESGPPVLALVKANRAGISAEHGERLRRPIVQSIADTTCSCRRSRAYHTLLGAVTGTFGGAALGAAVGAIMDDHADGDYMIPASAILAAYGIVIGLVVGSVVGLAWPTS